MTLISKSSFDEIKKNIKRQAKTRAFYTIIFILSIVFIIILGVDVANERNAGSFSRGITKVFDFPIDIISDAFERGWGWYPLLLKYFPTLLSTVNMALFATLVGFFGAVIMSLLASRNLIKNKFIVQCTRRLLDILRSFPEIIIATLLLYLMGQSILPAFFAIAIHTIGVLGKLFSEVIENIDEGPIEGLTSLGSSWPQKIIYGVFPQVFPHFVSYTMLRLEINVRSSTILGFVGAGGIGQALKLSIAWRFGDHVSAIMVLIIVTIVIIDRLSSLVRHRVIGLKI
jgi:phosphonate transport system permease protein